MEEDELECSGRQVAVLACLEEDLRGCSGPKAEGLVVLEEVGFRLCWGRPLARLLRSLPDFHGCWWNLESPLAEARHLLRQAWLSPWNQAA